MKFKLKVNGILKGEFDTNQEAMDHFEKHRLLGFWGKEEHTIHHEEQVIHHDEISELKEILDGDGGLMQDKRDFVAAYDEIIPAYDEQVPAEYTYVIEDHTAEVELERTKKETKHNDRLTRVQQLKALDFNSISTIAQLKSVVRILVKEAIKDDE